MDICYSLIGILLLVVISILYGKVKILSDDIDKIKLKCGIEDDGYDDEENT